MTRISVGVASNSKQRIGTLMGKPLVIGDPNLVTDDELLVVLDTESDDIFAIKQRGNRVTGVMDNDGFETLSIREGSDSESGGSNVNLMSITITNNGTYHSASGYAYSEVKVNVQNDNEATIIFNSGDSSLSFENVELIIE